MRYRALLKQMAIAQSSRPTARKPLRRTRTSTCALPGTTRLATSHHRADYSRVHTVDQIADRERAAQIERATVGRPMLAATSRIVTAEHLHLPRDACRRAGLSISQRVAGRMCCTDKAFRDRDAYRRRPRPAVDSETANQTVQFCLTSASCKTFTHPVANTANNELPTRYPHTDYRKHVGMQQIPLRSSKAISTRLEPANADHSRKPRHAFAETTNRDATERALHIPDRQRVGSGSKDDCQIVSRAKIPDSWMRENPPFALVGPTFDSRSV